MKWVVKAEHLKDFQIVVTFNSGETGTIDLKQHITGLIYAPLKDIEYFKKFYVHPELNVITWPNGADFSPEFLFGLIKPKASA